MAGLAVTVEGERIVHIEPDPENIMGRHGTCGLCVASAGASTDPRRLTRPRKRNGSQWEEISWSQAISEISAKLKDLRKQHGPSAIGLYAGHPVGTNSRGLLRTLAFTLGVDTPHLYSPLSTTGGPWLYATELVVGYAAPLQGDVGRAHYVVLLGANQDAQGWGPFQAGRSHAADLAFSRKTKGTKVVTVDSRKTPVAAAADLHLSIRPGTELFFVLGMIQAIIKNNWSDAQYVRDYCTPVEPLIEALAPWPLERCAEICGLGPADIQAVALKFSRAAMAVVHRSPQALNSRHGTLTAWALLVAHALTANLLRPGGIYENAGVIDSRPVAQALPTARAPRTRTGNYPLVLLQAPGAVLADEILSGGEGQLRALISLHGDPARDLPGGAKLKQALDSLELLVAVDVADNETTKHAHYVLPSTHAWEREDVHLHDTGILPYHAMQWTAALATPPGEAKNEADILADIFRKLGPTLRHGAFGTHLKVIGAAAALTDAAWWEDKLLAQADGPSYQTLRDAPHGWNKGDVDRSPWRPSHPDGRLHLLPDEIRDALARLDVPAPTASFPLRLLSGAARDMAHRAFDRPQPVDPGVTLHPRHGFTEGQRVRVVTAVGAVETTAHVDPTLHPDAVDLPAGYVADVMALLPTDQLDPLTGTPDANGLLCRVEAC